jgi:UDP-perosamine 4-acetyltransferase
MNEAPREAVVLGGGGHARVLLDLIGRAGGLVAKAILDPDPSLIGRMILGVPVVGDDAALDAFPPNRVLLVNGVGSVRDTGARRDLFLRCRDLGYRFATLVHPTAVLATGVALGEGAQVLAGAVVNTGARLGENCIVNTAAVVEHDCIVGAHVHVATGAVLAGGVTLGEGVHVGAGATVIQGITVGAGAVIGAGAVVVRHVAMGTTVLGVPARPRHPEGDRS